MVAKLKQCESSDHQIHFLIVQMTFRLTRQFKKDVKISPLTLVRVNSSKQNVKCITSDKKLSKTNNLQYSQCNPSLRSKKKCHKTQCLNLCSYPRMRPSAEVVCRFCQTNSHSHSCSVAKTPSKTNRPKDRTYCSQSCILK